ncbi:MAG: hypothetical protein AAF743_07005 [Planctomycetota bacterium]
MTKDVTAVMQTLRGATSAMIDALPGRVRRAADLVRLLGIDTKLASQLIRLARPEHALLEVAADVPGPRSAARLAKLLDAEGIASDELTKAFAEYESLITRHATSRRAFAAIVAGLGNDTDQTELAEERERRNAFRAHRHLLGRQCDLIHTMFLLTPGSAAGHYDTTVIYLIDGLQRLRPEQALHLARMGRPPKHEKGTPRIRFEPLVKGSALPVPGKGDGGRPDASLLTRFCSKPTPTVVSELDEQGVTVYRLGGKKLGTGSATRVAVGQVRRNYASPEYDDPPHIGLSVTATTPARMLVLDVILVESLAEKFTPADISTQAYLPMAGFGDGSPDQFRPPTLRNVGTDLGKLDDAATPMGGQLAWFAVETLGVSEVMRAFRAEVEYPVMLARVAARFKFRESVLKSLS